MHLCAHDLLDSSQNKVIASLFFGGGWMRIHVRAQEGVPSQQVWKMKRHFHSSGTSSFFASENLSSISLFDMQLSGRDWLEENGCDEVHLMGLTGKTKFPYFSRRRRVNSHFPKTCSGSSSLCLTLAMPMSSTSLWMSLYRSRWLIFFNMFCANVQNSFIYVCQTTEFRKPECKVIYKSHFRSQRNNVRQNRELMYLLFLYIHWLPCKLILSKTQHLK